MNLFSDVVHSQAMTRMRDKFDQDYMPQARPKNGRVLNDGSVLVDGQIYRFQDGDGIPVGKDVEVVNKGRGADAVFGLFNNERRLRDKLPYQTDTKLMVVEEDGSPAVSEVIQLVVPNGTLTDNGGGSVSLTVAAGGGGGGQVCFGMWNGVVIGTFPGPSNLSDNGRTITAYNIVSDGECAGSATLGGTFSFAAGGDSASATGQSTAWAAGAELSVTVTTIGSDATYLKLEYLYE